MLEHEETPRSLLNPALTQVQRIEKALTHTVKVLELELSGIALDPDSLDDRAKADLRLLGAAFLRLSSLGLTTATGVSNVLDDGQLYQMRTPEAPNAHRTVASQEVPIVREAGLLETRAHEEIGTVITPPSREETITHLPPTSRLNRIPPAKQENASSTGIEAGSEYDTKLYSRILPLDEIPTMELREGMSPINALIMSDNVLSIGDRQVKLRGDRLFAFNALMQLRDQINSAKDLKDLGFRPGSSNVTATSQAFSTAMKGLTDSLHEASGAVVIRKIGERAGTKYAVNPALTLTDTRILAASDVESNEPEIVKKNG